MNWSNDETFLREIILMHYDKPNNKVDDNVLLENYLSYHNKSESCIDDIKVFLLIENELIKDAKFSGLGCAISTASTDILCDLLKDKSVKSALEILDQYWLMIQHETFDEQLLQELMAFKNIYQQPNRIKCALIGKHAIEQLLKVK